jgi:hypothetical protein
MTTLLCLNNIYINIGDNQYKLLRFNDYFDFKDFYFNNLIEINHNNNIKKINLLNKKYFQIKIIHLGNYIFIYIFNKTTFFDLILYKSSYNNLNEYNYSIIIFLKFKLKKLIRILKQKLGKEINFPQDTIDNIIKKTDIIINEIDDLNEQKILYYIQYIKNNFHI